MALVSVKSKFQVVIPQNVPRRIGLRVGDLLEASIERGKITFMPKAIVDRGIAESLRDFKQGHSYGPFENPEDLVASLHKEAEKLHSKTRRRRNSRT